MTISKRAAQIMCIGAIVVAALITLVFESSISETDMVMMSYIWAPIVVTGAAIWITGKNTLKFALKWFVLTLLALFVFFVQIFPML